MFEKLRRKPNPAPVDVQPKKTRQVFMTETEAKTELKAVEYFQNLKKSDLRRKDQDVTKYLTFGIGSVQFSPGFLVTIDDENRVLDASPMQQMRILT